MRAGAVGVTSVDGVAVSPSTRVFPRLRVVPMGWSHALWWCQRVMERAAEAAGCSASQRIQDGRPCPCLHRAAHLEYVDKSVALGYSADAVESNVRAVVKELTSRGLIVTEESHAGEDADSYVVLGWSIDSGGSLSSTASRLWRSRMAVRGILARGRCSGRDLEKVLGHLIFISLARPEGLSVLGSVFRFIRTCYHTETPCGNRYDRSSRCGKVSLLCCDEI